MVYKLKHRQLGRHTHVSVFAATRLNTTFCKVGELVFGEGEWEVFRDALHAGAGAATFLFEKEEGSA